MLDPYDNYYLVKERMRELTEERRFSNSTRPEKPFWPWVVLLFFIAVCFLSSDAFAAMPRLPGTDQSDKLQAAGSLLRIIDVALFSWGARIFAGLLILNAGICLKNQAFGLAIISIIGAILIGTGPIWVKNIFDMGGGTLFSMIPSLGGVYV
ncbi:MAG: hypothetical protein COW79_07695 [Bdellovibrionales bacterium CG22_combo_CG10-13_8_21_14_all_38_13]|nr:MAG: hypothetical protein COW79_07695 [Bdellovibrionales bacterium CG22_combo_CG10-13_8_21_14_all_38_13]